MLTENVRVEANNFLPKIELSPEQDAFVGRLWSFPSDHLPVCCKVDGYRIGTFNLLNTKFVDYAIKGRLGWENSSITQGNQIASPMDKLTIRDKHVSLIIQTLLGKENDRKALDCLCIQECSDEMYNHLKAELQEFTGKSFDIVLGDGGHDNHVAIIYNTSLFSVENFKSEPVFKRYINSIDSWVLDNWRPVADICLKEKIPHSNEPKIYRVITAHVSSAGEGDTYKVDRLSELHEYAINKIDVNIDATILTGDLNAEKTLLNSIFEDFTNLASHYSHITSYMSPRKPDSKHYLTLVDHLLVKSEGQEVKSKTINLHDLLDSRAFDVYSNAITTLLQ